MFKESNLEGAQGGFPRAIKSIHSLENRLVHRVGAPLLKAGLIGAGLGLAMDCFKKGRERKKSK